MAKATKGDSTTLTRALPAKAAPLNGKAAQPGAGAERTPEVEAERIAELFHNIGRVFGGVKPKRLKSGLYNYNLTMAQGRCLWAITKHKNFTLRELSQHLGVSPSTVSELVDPLVRAELVQRETDEHDRRVVRLNLAPKGQQHFTQMKKHRNAHFRLFLDHLEKEQRQTMLSALETLNQIIEQVEQNERG